jgi:hypothetical protein
MACDEAWNRHFHHRVRHSHRHDHKDGHHTHAHADGFNGVHEHLHEHEPVVHSHARPHGVDPWHPREELPPAFDPKAAEASGRKEPAKAPGRI